MENKTIIDSKIDKLFTKSRNSRIAAFNLYIVFYKYLLDTTRDGVLKFFLWFSISTMIISSFYYLIPLAFIQNNKVFIEKLSILLISISASILAAIIVEITERLKKIYEEYFRYYQLRRLFNCDSDDGRVIIALSKFEMSHQNKNEGSYRSGNDKELIQDKDKSLDDAHYFSTIAYNDAIAAANIASIFTNHNMTIPKIFLDMEIINSIFEKNQNHGGYKLVKKNEQKKYKNILHYDKLQTIICVGLYSNELSMWLNDDKTNIEKRLFKITPRDKNKNPIGTLKVRPVNAKKEVNYTKWDSSEYSGKISKDGLTTKVDQFAIFARCRVEHLNFIIIGGQTALSTRELSLFLYKNWEDIAKTQDERGNKIIGEFGEESKSFAYVFELETENLNKNKELTHKKLIID